MGPSLVSDSPPDLRIAPRVERPLGGEHDLKDEREPACAVSILALRLRKRRAAPFPDRRNARVELEPVQRHERERQRRGKSTAVRPVVTSTSVMRPFPT